MTSKSESSLSMAHGSESLSALLGPRPTEMLRSNFPFSSLIVRDLSEEVQERLLRTASRSEALPQSRIP